MACRAPFRSRIGVLLLTALMIGGCGKAYSAGQKAEKRGAHHEAYDHYCRAAAKSPESNRIAAAIRRVAARASEFWTAQGRAAEDQGQYDAAWRMYARALEVRPDDASALEHIRSLQDAHGDVIAVARRDWIMRGHRALKDIGHPLGEALAMAPPLHESSKNNQPETPASPDGEEKATHVRTDLEQTNTSPPPSGPAAQLEAALSRQTSPQDPNASRDKRTRNRDRFLAIHVLSRKDRRYVKTAESVDGVTLKLTDTDDEGDADINIYHGRRRVKKIRDIRVGQSVSFSGRSGRLLRLIILDIRHKSQTVRLGIRPA
ncbi:MAG: hypothetical protein O7B26_03160 [Planctomycetota bacterium]|nr:hypothetical protein [Planctomycetota bacterium]